MPATITDFNIYRAVEFAKDFRSQLRYVTCTTKISFLSTIFMLLNKLSKFHDLRAHVISTEKVITTITHNQDMR